ncbi:hypothetical protein TrVE_jg7684 [Triparma verrucosa]|uniref:Uncharacterized protein n=1 Tax=Triparma verrucosa TaxID=1606542 RepID=A0A9W7CI77_9STRA|nr:hypothetical protein TrVE_jg7684 [Triparma verrucosa]
MLGMWSLESNSWKFSSNSGYDPVQLPSDLGTQTSMLTIVSCVALKSGATYVHRLDATTLKLHTDTQVDKDYLTIVFDETEQYSRLDQGGAIIVVDVDDIVGVTEQRAVSDYEWQLQNDKDGGTSRQKVQVKKRTDPIVASAVKKGSGSCFRYKKNVDEDGDEDYIDGKIPAVGTREQTVEVSTAFKRPEMLAMLLKKLEENASWDQDRKFGFILIVRNPLLRRHFSKYWDEDEEDDEDGVEEDVGGGTPEVRNEAAEKVTKDKKAIRKLARSFGKDEVWICEDKRVKYERLSGRVYEIDWSGCGLSGRINAKALKKLDALKVLKLHNNSITGSIVGIDDLQHLQELTMYQNSMDGPLTCEKLRTLPKCELLRGDDNTPERNNWSMEACPDRFVIQMERNFLRISARKLGKNNIWLEQGNGQLILSLAFLSG